MGCMADIGTAVT